MKVIIAMDLRVCLVATELFAWGRLGGFGAATRLIGGELARRGVRVSVVVPAGEGQRPVEELDGMEVHGFPLHRYPFTRRLYSQMRADVYHSEEPSWGTRLALEAAPAARHVATSQNPKTTSDWSRVERYYPNRRRVYNRLIAPSVDSCVARIDAVYCQAWHTIPKVKEIYGLSTPPGFLPNPVKIPPPSQKPTEPTVCFLGRFDREKCPEAFFGLAEAFPEVRFVAAGAAHDRRRDGELRRRYSGVRNLELPGFLLGAEKERLLSESRVLVNTSVSECLPVSFLEAAAHGCAILSPHDPDGFAIRFGHHVRDGDYASGLRWLLDGGSWREAGERGRRYVSSVHEAGRVIDRHIEAYGRVLATPRPSS